MLKLDCGLGSCVYLPIALHRCTSVVVDLCDGCGWTCQVAAILCSSWVRDYTWLCRTAEFVCVAFAVLRAVLCSKTPGRFWPASHTGRGRQQHEPCSDTAIKDRNNQASLCLRLAHTRKQQTRRANQEKIAQRINRCNIGVPFVRGVVLPHARIPKIAAKFITTHETVRVCLSNAVSVPGTG